MQIIPRMFSGWNWSSPCLYVKIIHEMHKDTQNVSSIFFLNLESLHIFYCLACSSTGFHASLKPSIFQDTLSFTPNPSAHSWLPFLTSTDHVRNICSNFFRHHSSASSVLHQGCFYTMLNPGKNAGFNSPLSRSRNLPATAVVIKHHKCQGF